MSKLRIAHFLTRNSDSARCKHCALNSNALLRGQDSHAAKVTFADREDIASNRPGNLI